ncbi:MAG: hypothetical protein ABJI96_19790 [Paracoccaceae bacterium]
MQFNNWIVVGAACLFLTACGDTAGQQALIGAGAGAGAAILLKTNPLAGAAVGAGANYLYCQHKPGKC